MKILQGSPEIDLRCSDASSDVSGGSREAPVGCTLCPTSPKRDTPIAPEEGGGSWGAHSYWVGCCRCGVLVQNPRRVLGLGCGVQGPTWGVLSDVWVWGHGWGPKCWILDMGSQVSQVWGPWCGDTSGGPSLRSWVGSRGWGP